MMRKVIEYLRRKQNITIDDLVVEICSNIMYYKYLSKEKNMSCKNLKLIKERLGADDLTNEEIQEFKKDLDKIIHNIMRYYISKEAFEKDIMPLIELESQLLLCDELCIDYIIAKINFLFLENNLDEISKLLCLLEEFFDIMTVTQKLFYYNLNIYYKCFYNEEINNLVDQFYILLRNNNYIKNYGFFHINLSYYFIRLKEKEKAYHSIETSSSMFIRDINIIGQVKSLNMKAVMFIENRRYDDALEILLLNYKNAKQSKFIHEMFNSLSNIMTSYLGLNDQKNAAKYWSIFCKEIFKINDMNIAVTLLYNNAISLFTNFEYYQMHSQLKELVFLFEKFSHNNNPIINNLISYYYMDDEEEKIKYIESTFLVLVIGRAHFSYCKWMLDKCIIYFNERRMYKKVIDLESKYLELFREYYFN